jgi:hypothetical protein
MLSYLPHPLNVSYDRPRLIENLELLKCTINIGTATKWGFNHPTDDNAHTPIYHPPRSPRPAWIFF